MIPQELLDKGQCITEDEDIKAAFFAETGNTYKKAKQVCVHCPVQQQCLDWVLSWENQSERYGVWGGTTARQREGMFPAELHTASVA